MIDETVAVEEAIQIYLTGHATNSASCMRRAFLPTAHIEGTRDGTFTTWTLEQYCDFFQGNPADDEEARIRTVDWIEIVGDSAAARATLIHGTVTFTDYFVLLKVDGQWRISNKVYHREPS